MTTGWLDNIDGGAAVGRFQEQGRDLTQSKRTIDLGRFDTYTGGNTIATQHRDVDIRGAQAVTVRGVNANGWSTRELKVQKVVNGQAVAIGAGKVISPSAPTLDLAESDIVGAEALRIFTSDAGSADALGAGVFVSVTVREPVTPAMTRVAVAGDATPAGSSTEFGG